ncbi:MAG: hypothetical protein Q9191_008370, partial [Dirinaria sp. TL-2023a]
MPENVAKLHAECKTSPSPANCTSLLLSLSAKFKRSFILVDALDEHFSNGDDDLLEMTFLDELLQLQHGENISPGYSIFLTSREHLVLQERLGACARARIYAADADIEMYLRSRIYDHTKFGFATKMREDPQLAQSILESLSSKAQGIVRNLRAALDSLPTKLDETYNEAMTRIRGQVSQHCELATLALTWISLALRPLGVQELQHALAIRPRDREFDQEALPDIALVVSVSAGLITVDEDGQAVRLVHFTVEEYFRKMKANLFPRADILLAEACITYLSYDQITNHSPPDEDIFPLLRYAAENWGHHLRGQAERTLQNQVFHFLEDERNLKYPKYIISLFIRNIYFGVIHIVACRLHLLVHFDLGYILNLYLEKDHVTDIEDGSFFTSLHLAAAEGRDGIVKLLLGRDDMNVNYLDMQERTPLMVAAYLGRDAIVRVLLDLDGVQADRQDETRRTPLSYAAEAGHADIVKMLLNRDDVQADHQDKYGQTPLSYAAGAGRKDIVEMLLNRDDVQADHQDEYGQTPLFYAAEAGRKDIVEILLNRDD